MTMQSRKYFGTDGIRGRLGEGAITPEFMLKLGWACGQVFKKRGLRNRVIIGKDTRISGYLFESALEAGLSAAGVDVRLIGPMPTPAIAYLTRTYRANAGIVISASHNPYEDNGIKFFSEDGFKLDDALELEIEALLDKPLECVEPENIGAVYRIDDAPGRYIEFCKSQFPQGLSLEGLKIVLDCANALAKFKQLLDFPSEGAALVIAIIFGTPSVLENSKLVRKERKASAIAEAGLVAVSREFLTGSRSFTSGILPNKANPNIRFNSSVDLTRSSINSSKKATTRPIKTPSTPPNARFNLVLGFCC